MEKIKISCERRVYESEDDKSLSWYISQKSTINGIHGTKGYGSSVFMTELPTNINEIATTYYFCERKLCAGTFYILYSKDVPINRH